MSDYTPTTEEVRELVVAGHENQYRDELGQLTGVSYGIEFDRWLTEVKAQAWEEAYTEGYRHGTCDVEPSDNPYRGENK